MSKARRKQLPKFGTEEQERKFWAEHDSAEFAQDIPEPTPDSTDDFATFAGVDDSSPQDVGEQA